MINNLVGYGLMEDGHFRGIWPLPLEKQKQAKERYASKAVGKLTIVPIYIGAPIEESTNERQRFAGRS